MALSFQETAAPYLKALTSEGWREWPNFLLR
jgi:hypothetical protein